MRRLLLILTIFTAPMFGGYAYQGTVTFGPATTATKTNFTVAFQFSHSKFATVANGGVIASTSIRNGVTVPNDFVFTNDATCASVTGGYTWQFEDYTDSVGSGSGHGWVKLPSFVTGAATVPTVCIGNSAISTFQGGTGTCAAFDASTVAVYPLSTNSGALNLNDFCNTANLSNENGVTAASGQIDGGAAFNGTNQALSIGAAGVSGTPITMSVWLKPSSSGIAMASLASGGVTWNGYFISAGGGTASFTTVSLDTFKSSGGLTATNGAWHCVVGVSASSSSRYVYVDGTKSTQGTDNITPSGTINNVTLGKAYHGGTGDNYYGGAADMARIDSVARSDDWIADGCSNQSSVPSVSALSPVTSSGGAAANLSVIVLQ